MNKEMRDLSRKFYLMGFNVAFPVEILYKALQCLPKDALVVGCDRDMVTGTNMFCVWSDKFSEVEKKDRIPDLLVHANSEGEVWLTAWNIENKEFEKISWN
jgi:hypothetical protein